MSAGDSLQAQLATLRPRLLRMAHLYLRNKVLAEDAVSDALLAVLEQPERFSGQSMLGTYVNSILKFKAIDILRVRSRECGLPDGELPACDEVEQQQARANPLVALEQAELFQIVNEGLALLPARSASIFRKRTWDESQSWEICAEYDVTLSNLHTISTRTRSHLKRYLAVNW